MKGRFWRANPNENKHICLLCGVIRGPNFLRCNKILSHHHFYFSFLPSLFLPYKETFMDDYDRILNYNDIKYGPYEIFDNFRFIIFYGDQNIEYKRIAIRTRPFLSCVVYFKRFSPYVHICLRSLGLFVLYICNQQQM